MAVYCLFLRSVTVQVVQTTSSKAVKYKTNNVLYSKKKIATMLLIVNQFSLKWQNRNSFLGEKVN